MGRRRTAEAGNASIALVGGVAMVMVMMVGLTDMAIMFIARSRAQTAADSAALAAAAELIPGLGTDPSGKAREFAEANGARLVDCRCPLGSSVAEVSVTVGVRLSLSGFSGIDRVGADSKAEVFAPGPPP